MLIANLVDFTSQARPHPAARQARLRFQEREVVLSLPLAQKPTSQAHKKVKMSRMSTVACFVSKTTVEVLTDSGIDVRDCYQASLEMLTRYNHQPMDYYQLSQKSTYIFSKAVTEAQEHYPKGQATLTSKSDFLQLLQRGLLLPRTRPLLLPKRWLSVPERPLLLPAKPPLCHESARRSYQS